MLSVLYNVFFDKRLTLDSGSSKLFLNNKMENDKIHNYDFYPKLWRLFSNKKPQF
jgi:hypothetical protein